MVHLIRRLVVALDQTGIGSEDRKQTQVILEVLSGEVEIPSDSSRWLDWLDEQPEGEPTWELVEERLLKGRPERVSVELPEDPKPPEGSPRLAITKEQQVWDQALKRSERMRSGRGRSLRNLLILSVIGALSYLGYQMWPEVQIWTQRLKNPKQPLELQPEILWGNFQPRLLQVPRKDLMAHLTGLPDLTMPSPLQHQDLMAPSIALRTWGRLHLQENTFNEGEEPRSMAILDPRVLSPGARRWQVMRESPDDGLQEFFFKEEIQLKNNRALLSVQRSRKGEGVAHKVMLDDHGMLAWTWKIVRKGQSLEGSLFRKKNPSRIEWSGKMFGGKQWSGQRLIQSEEVVLPAIWTPALHPLRHQPVLHSMGGRITSGELFWSDTELKTLPGEVLELNSRLEEWKERWNPSGVNGEGP